MLADGPNVTLKVKQMFPKDGFCRFNSFLITLMFFNCTFLSSVWFGLVIDVHRRSYPDSFGFFVVQREEVKMQQPS